MSYIVKPTISTVYSVFSMTQRNFEQLNRMAARFRCDTGGSVNRKKLKAVHALTDHASAVKSPKTIFPPMRINNAFSLTHAGYLLKSSLSSHKGNTTSGKLNSGPRAVRLNRAMEFLARFRPFRWSSKNPFRNPKDRKESSTEFI